MKNLIIIAISILVSSCDLTLSEDNSPQIRPISFPDTCSGNYFKRIANIPSYIDYWQVINDSNFIVFSGDSLFKLSNKLDIITSRPLDFDVIMDCAVNIDKNIWVLCYEYYNNRISLIDTLGNIIMDFNLAHQCKNLAATNDGGFVLGYSLESPTNYDTTYSIDKYNKQGLFQWTKSSGLAGKINCIYQTSDNSFLAGGYCLRYKGFEVEGTNPYLAMHDAKGKLLWKKIYPSDRELNYEIISITEFPNKEYCVVFNHQGCDVNVTRVDSLGNIIWQTKISEWNISFNNLLLNQNGDIIISCYMGVAWGDIILTKLNSSGSKLWTRKYGGDGDEYEGYVLEFSNGDLLLLGLTINYNGFCDVGYTNTYIIKTNNQGITCY